MKIKLENSTTSLSMCETELQNFLKKKTELQNVVYLILN